MPIKGRNRRAKPAAVYAGLKPDVPYYPKPGRTETFAAYAKRLAGAHDPVLEMLTALGFGEPSQHKYLSRLSEVREILYRLDTYLFRKWPEE